MGVGPSHDGRFLNRFGVILLLAFVDCRKCGASGSHDASVATIIDSGPTDAGVARCREPSRLTLVKKFEGDFYWKGREIWTQKTRLEPMMVLDPETLALRPRTDEERDANDWLREKAKYGALLPSNVEYGGIRDDRWVLGNTKTKTRIVVDAIRHHQLTGEFSFVERGRGMQPIEGSDDLMVIDLESEKELYRCPSCAKSTCTFSPSAGMPMTTTARAVHCVTDSLNAMEAIVALDDSSHPHDRVCRHYERTAPNDTYVVGLSMAAHHSNASFLPATRPAVDYRRMYSKPTKTLLTDVEVDSSRTNEVAFCGEGELFAVYATRPGARPKSISIFRGSDGALLASASGVDPPRDASDEFAEVSDAEFDESGRFFAVYVREAAPGPLPDPRDPTAIFDLDTTYLYRLDP